MTAKNRLSHRSHNRAEPWHVDLPRKDQTPRLLSKIVDVLQSVPWARHIHYSVNCNLHHGEVFLERYIQKMAARMIADLDRCQA